MPHLPPAQTQGQRSAAYEAAVAWLMGRINYERAAVIPYGQQHMKLDRMRQLLVRLGNPDVGMPIVHVAGTKGKGSTSAMIAGMLQSAGYDVGLYSSPHLQSIEERFLVNGLCASEAEFVALADQLRTVVEAMDREAAQSAEDLPCHTYFELTTALALMHFAQQKVDVGVLEVGLGGRLDSTNVCQSAVTVIASISLDHTKQLGSTVEEIAAEKAGIIKPGVPVLCGPLADGPRRVIAEVARQHGSRMWESGRDFFHSYRPPQELERRDALGRLDFWGEFGHEEFRLQDVRLQLLGEHQAANAALALATAVKLRQQGWLLSSDSMRETLARLTIPGRSEIVRRNPVVLMDVAHNVASAEALVDVIRTSFAAEDRVLLFAATRDKDVRGIVRVLLPHFQKVIVTEYQTNPRAVATDRLGQIVREELERLSRTADQVVEQPSLATAWRLARQGATPGGLLCITGSFFVVAELRPLVLQNG